MAFDPLHKWLGIPASEQPPNHYRLLGLAAFEEDRDVIDAAADKQLAFLHDMTNGPHSAEAEEISNQVSSARVCLCNQKKKKAYDAKLKAKDVPAPPARPKVPHFPVAAESAPSQQSGWFLKHKDGVVHGPFPFEGLTEAAKRGRVAPSTMVRHELVTSDQWIDALSLPKIAQACPPQPQAAVPVGPTVPSNAAAAPVSTPVLTVSSKRSSGRRSSSHAGVMTYVSSIVPGLLLILLVVVVYRNPRLRSAVAGMLSPQAEQAEPEVEVRVIRPPSVRRPSTRRPTRPAVPERAEPETEVEPPNANTFAAPEIVERPFQFPNSLGLNDGTEHRFRLDLESTRWADKIPDANRSQRIEIVRIENAISNVTYDPPTAELSFDRDVRVTFEALEGFAMILRLAEVGAEKEITLTGRYESERSTPFRWTTFKKQQKVVTDAVRQAENQVNSLMTEQAQLNKFISLGGDKRLSTYKNAQIRLRAIRTQLPAAQSLVLTQRKRWNQILPIVQEIEALNSKGELVIRTLDPDSPSESDSTSVAEPADETSG